MPQLALASWATGSLRPAFDVAETTEEERPRGSLPPIETYALFGVTMFTEDDLLMISSLQHLCFCERQFALIHVEQLWEENQFTAEGKVLHERVDTEGHESRRLFRQEFGMAVRSLSLGLIGKCDLVEFRLAPDGHVVEIVPIEFKRGSDKDSNIDRVQLCAQALCLEEMLGVMVPKGQFYYFQDHRRKAVDLIGDLRAETLSLITHARELRASGITPPALYEKRKCDRCSLIELCMPKNAGAGGKRVDRFIQTQIQASRMEGI